MTELDEVAESLARIAPRFASWHACVEWVATVMPGESCGIIAGVTEALFTAQPAQADGADNPSRTLSEWTAGTHLARLARDDHRNC